MFVYVDEYTTYAFHLALSVRKAKVYFFSNIFYWRLILCSLGAFKIVAISVITL